MSYISAVRRGDEVIVWERAEEGRSERTFRSPYYFFIEDPAGDYVSMHGTNLTKLSFRNGKEFREAKADFKSSGVTLYESDVPPELRVLSEHYYGKPAPTLNVTFLDIEVDYNKEVGFSSVSNPYAPINAVAFYHTWRDQIMVFAVPPKKGKWIATNIQHDLFIQQLKDIAPIDSPFDVIFFDDERELLLNLLVEIEDSDVLCGWNSDMFDMPYIAKRIEKVLGKKYLRKLSFDGADVPKYREVEAFGNVNTTVDLFGRESVDYLALFKKYEMDGRPSYKLESIADEIVPELPKLKYEGTLADLYHNNFVMFIRYNIRDTEILKALEDRLGYVALANEMVHISTGLFSHALGTLKLAELAVINFCHHELNVRVNDNDMSGSGGSIQGAYVLEPKIGMHDLFGAIDIKSLYPSSIRSINISPETLIGQFVAEEKAAEAIANNTMAPITLTYEDGSSEERTADEWREELVKRKWAVSGFGTVFNQDKKGIIPSILETWYNTRMKYQKLKKEAQADGNKTLASYYDRLQYVYKIKLNSLYGALTNQYFRFYDLRMGESTTGTGRGILRHQCAKVNELMTGEYDAFGEAIIYGDTDSTYFETWAENEEEAIQIADMVAARVNSSYQRFMQKTFLCQPGFDSLIEAEREIVASRGIFVEKKRYILRVIDKDGKKVDYLKVMGLDTKKTTLPAHVSTVLNNFVGRLLKGEAWEDIAQDIVAYKDELRSSPDISVIGLPKGVQKVEDYTQRLKLHGDGANLPGHVAASIHYNQCLDRYGDHESLRIISGMKIKVFYLTKKVGRFKSIALPTDAEFIPQWFLDNFKIDKDAHIERLVDNPLNNIIKAIGKDVPSKQSLMVDSLLDF